ncbi:hypothetical protein CPL00345_CDS0157 [Klebsiella phage GlastoCabaret]
MSPPPSSAQFTPPLTPPPNLNRLERFLDPLKSISA